MTRFKIADQFQGYQFGTICTFIPVMELWHKNILVLYTFHVELIVRVFGIRLWCELYYKDAFKWRAISHLKFTSKLSLVPTASYRYTTRFSLSKIESNFTGVTIGSSHFSNIFVQDLIKFHWRDDWLKLLVQYLCPRFNQISLTIASRHWSKIFVKKWVKFIWRLSCHAAGPISLSKIEANFIEDCLMPLFEYQI